MNKGQGYAYLTKQAAIPGMQFMKNLVTSGRATADKVYNYARNAVNTQGGLRNVANDAYSYAKSKIPQLGQIWQMAMENKSLIAGGLIGTGIGAYMGNKAYNSYNAYPQPQQYYGAYPQQYYGYYPQQMPGPGQPIGNAYGAAPYVNQG